MAHPYSPQSAVIPGWIPNETPILHLAAEFAALAGGAVILALLFARQCPSWHGLRSIDVFAVAWFALCGFLHCFFEGYFVHHQGRLAGMQTLFAQLWKYYSLADSRYITLDNFTVVIEFLTALIWGPLSWLTVYSITARSPSRHILQIIMCVAHIYGVVLYFGTEYRNEKLTGDSASLPDFLFYWVYYVGFNIVWAFVPAWLLWDSWMAITRAISFCEADTSLKKDR
ncbi:hypothetical protein NLU13_6079 [Sarocladium strictum]|uniref:EXPERA domain-containing protein n=1 Tax=Sarocladium strictum TaxID=5046 RepID=A0AA39GF85_SARSR|nr:hypothetical protein NLU13_6079 [Sarocladium strictum]